MTEAEELVGVLTDEECRQYAERQTAGKLTAEDAENCQRFTKHDISRICEHLPLQTQPMLYAGPLGMVLLRNVAHCKKQASRDVAAGLRALIEDIRSARPDGLFPKLSPESGLDKGAGSLDHKSAALAWSLTGPVADDFWRERSIETLNGLIEAVLSQKFDDEIETLGRLVGGHDGKYDLEPIDAK